jgi:hypothetical protein
MILSGRFGQFARREYTVRLDVEADGSGKQTLTLLAVHLPLKEFYVVNTWSMATVHKAISLFADRCRDESADAQTSAEPAAVGG